MNKFQKIAEDFLKRTFNKKIIYSKEERAYRFLEESLELVQSLDIPKDKVLEFIEYVYNKPEGYPSKEIGDVQITLACMCVGLGIDLEEVSYERMRAALENAERIKERWKNKPNNIKDTY